MDQQNQFNQPTTPQEPQSSLQPEVPQKPRLPSWATVLIIIAALFIVGLVSYGAYRYFVSQPEPLEKPLAGEEPAEESSGATVDWGYFENKSLGISFRYPTNWGEVEEKENISINYLFPSYLPDKLKEAFLNKGLGEDFITEFEQWSGEKQADFLKKDIDYNDFLSRDFVISFSKKDELTLHAFNKSYVNMSGYEAAVSIYPSYQGNLSLSQNACSQELKSIISQVNIDNFYKDDCSLLENELVVFKGTVNDIFPSGEEALIVAVANLKKPEEYNGLLMSYYYKNFENPSSQLLTYFGYSGGLIEEDSSVNIKACNSFGGGSAPSTITFQNFYNRKIDDNFISEFKEKITSDINKMNIDREISEMVISKLQEELENNKGNTSIDYRPSDKEKYYCLWCSNYNEQMDNKINSFPDIKKYLSEMTHNDLLCSLYKIDKKANLDSFREEVENDIRITELNNFLSTISITD